jgi:hypothetical protein
MQTRRDFIFETGVFAIGSMLLPSVAHSSKKVKNTGVQLYTFRKEMQADPNGTLHRIASLGITQIESARSE